MTPAPHIRNVDERDAAAIAAIYGHHVRHGTASYDYEPPPEQFHRDKIRRIAGEGWPFIVAQVDGEVAGYAYATQFRDRAAYLFTCETSIYIDPDHIGKGVGRALLEALMERAAAFGFKTMIAVIGGAEPASIAVHARCGFVEAGRLTGVGWKHERWLDSVYMQRDIAPRDQ